MTRKSVSALATGLMGAALFVVAPNAAGAAPADPCQLGWSNVEPRSCAQADVGLPPVLTLGDGICAGVLSAQGTAFDGPLWDYSDARGSTHSIEMRISQGFSPLGEWAPTFLACDVTVNFDWQNLDTGQSGTVSQHVPATNNGTHPAFAYVGTGPGRVRLTVHTDHPSIPVSTEVIVP